MLRRLTALLSFFLLTLRHASGLNITMIVPAKEDELKTLASGFTLPDTPKFSQHREDDRRVYVRVVNAGWGGLFAAIKEAAENNGFISVDHEGKVQVPEKGVDREESAKENGWERVKVDIAWVGSTWFGSFQNNYRMFHPLDTYFEEWAAERASGQITVDFASGLDFDYRMSIAGGDPMWYGFPLDVGARIFFYRKDMFREVFGNDDPPATLEDMEIKGRQIKEFYAARGRNVSGAGVSTKTVDGPTIQDFSTWFIGHGASITVTDDSCGYETPEFQRAFDQHARIYSGPDKLDYKINSTQNTLMADFLEGELAQGIFGSWAYWMFLDQKPEFEGEENYLANVGMTAPPAGPARRSTFFGSSAWTILESSTNKDESFEFIKSFSEPGTPRHKIFIGGDLPPFNSMLDVALFDEASIPAKAMVKVLRFAYPQTFPEKDYARFAGDVEAGDVIQQMVNNVHMGAMSTTEAIEWGCQRTREVLAEAQRIRDERFPDNDGVGGFVITESNQLALILSLSICGGVIITLLLAFMLWRRKSKMTHRNLVEAYMDHAEELERDKKAAMIPFEDIEFGAKIGAGAFGDVFRGEVHGTPVAIKKLRVTSSSVADELRAEAAVIARLRHPNVCLFMGTSTDPADGSLCLVTEFLEHGSVYDMIRNSAVALDLNLVATFLKGAALGCAYLHAREPPLLHKDIKSLNILADANLVPKICDFGLSDQTKNGGVVSVAEASKVVRDGVKVGRLAKAPKAEKGARADSSISKNLSNSPLTMSMTSTGISTSTSSMSESTNLPPGSLYWMAPEVARGEPFTKAADVYSFGITMWELIARDDPYGGDNPFAVIQQVIENGRRPEIPKTVPTQLADLMRECWAEDPTARPSFKEIFQRLNTAFGGTVGTMQTATSAASAPTGEVTLVFTDVKGSTELWEAQPVSMRIALGLHNSCARSLIREHGGYEVKTEGDAFMVAFAKPLSAVRWACALQEQLIQLDWPEDLLEHEHASIVKIGHNKLYAGLRVRIGVHTAKVQAQLDASTRRMDYFGRGVNKSARVSGKAQGGQVVITEDTLAGAGGEEALKAFGFEVIDLGPVYMKGITEPANMFQVLPQSLQGRTFQSVGLASTAGQGISQARFATRRNSSDPPTSASGFDEATCDSGTPFEFDGALGRVQALVKKQAWAIDYADVKIGSVVGHGSFGQVFDAMYRGQRVAVKKLLAHKLSESNLLYFFEEMSILSHMRHPNIVMFVGATVDPPAIITEFSPRGTLEEILSTNKKTQVLDLADKISIAKQVASAMVYLASAKPPLLHRDLKSANVLIMANNVAKIADFGLTTARRASSTMSSVGTPGFMAPEVLAGDNYASSADVFAFGMLLYEIITEIPPFQGLPAIKVGQTVLRGGRCKFPVSTTSKKELEGLVALVKNCWHQDPAARPSFEDILERLDAIAERC